MTFDSGQLSYLTTPANVYSPVNAGSYEEVAIEQYAGLVEKKEKITGEKTWLSSFTVKNHYLTSKRGSIVKKNHVAYFH